MSEPYALGVDGCPGGWFAAWIDEDGAITNSVHPSILALLEAHPRANPILIDIPMGLATGGVGRSCDREARRILGSRRASSVFSPPCRDAVRAGDYTAACDVNQTRTGARLSMQSWAIVPKIREVDDVLTAQPALSDRVLEVHPEVLFWGLAGGRSMEHRKKTSAGALERLATLRPLLPTVDASYEAARMAWPRSVLGKDDILDAYAAAITGVLAQSAFLRLPKEPELDDAGLPMQMLYWRRG
jgi:predicted RNase H-like nuclease